jgi:hypothetical protein
VAEAVAEAEAEAGKKQREAGGGPLEEMIIFMKQVNKESSVENLARLQRQWQRQGQRQRRGNGRLGACP